MFYGAICFQSTYWRLGCEQCYLYVLYVLWCHHAFNQPIGDWDVSNVTDMGYMFYDASSFNQPIGDWDVGNVDYMAYMFYQASAFNQDISNWCVTNIDFRANSILVLNLLWLESNKPVWGTCPSITAIPDANFERALIELWS